MKYLLLFTCLLCSFLYAQAQTRLFHYGREGYSVRYPETWRIDTSRSLMDIPLFLFAPKDSPEDSVFENLHISAQALNGQDMNLGAMLAPSIQEYASMFQGFLLIDSATTILDGKPAARIAFTYNPGNLQLRMITTYIKGKDKLYIINVTAEERSYARYAQSFDAIIGSFRADE